MENNLRNHLSGSPTGTPTLELFTAAGVRAAALYAVSYTSGYEDLCSLKLPTLSCLRVQVRCLIEDPWKDYYPRLRNLEIFQNPHFGKYKD